MENLVRQWSPLVWLAPSEQFMPGNVNHFLSHVHAEKPAPVPASTNPQNADILDVSDDVLLYELDREIGVEQSIADGTSSTDFKMQLDRRERRVDRVIDLPVGKKSLDWFLVSNDDIGKQFVLFNRIFIIFCNCILI